MSVEMLVYPTEKGNFFWAGKIGGAVRLNHEDVFLFQFPSKELFNRMSSQSIMEYFALLCELFLETECAYTLAPLPNSQKEEKSR